MRISAWSFFYITVKPIWVDYVGFNVGTKFEVEIFIFVNFKSVDFRF